MGLSIAISGGIITFAIIYVMMSFPVILDGTAKLSTSSQQMSSTLNTIMHTNVSISGLVNSHDTDLATFSVTNTGNTILWNFKEFDAIITYKANTGGTPTLTEALAYTNSCDSLASGQWCIQNISNDLIHPGMLDPKEIANIHARLQNPTDQNSTLTLNFGTDNGVMDTSSVRTS
jgi:archaeal flagellar protein FlaF